MRGLRPVLIYLIIAIVGVVALGTATISPVASAQPPSSCLLRGREVRASDRAPIAGMTVSTTVFAGISENTVSTVTDADGRWSLRVGWSFANGYHVSFSHPEYQSMTRRLVLDQECNLFGSIIVFDTPEAALDHLFATEFPFEVAGVTLHAEQFGVRTYLIDCGNCSATFRVFVGQGEAGYDPDAPWNVIAWLSDVRPTAQTVPDGWVGDAQQWGRHGFNLSIGADGRAVATWRTYRWCSDDPAPPCDSFRGNEIVSGGRATIVLSTGVGSSMYGRVIESTQPDFLPLGPVALTGVDDDALWLSWDDYGLLLCGQPDGYLAAELFGQSCGA